MCDGRGSVASAIPGQTALGLGPDLSVTLQAPEARCASVSPFAQYVFGGRC